MRSREIKFRAWHKLKKELIEWDEMLKADNPAAWFTGHLKTVILMQATGIKDLNGKEIYEGDILSTQFIKDMGEDGKCISVVIWNEFVGAWQISYTGAYGGAASDTLTKYKHEVIGNVAENKELIPVQDTTK